MTLFASWAYTVTLKPYYTRWNRQPNERTGDPGEVAVFGFTVARGKGTASQAVDVTVSRDEVLRDYDLGGEPPASSCLVIAQGIARRKAFVAFKQLGATGATTP